MQALTIWQPWAHLIVYDDKCIENRRWKPPANSLAQPIAIHAAVRVPSEGELAIARSLASIPFPVAKDLTYAAIVGVAILFGFVDQAGRVVSVDPAFHDFKHSRWRDPNQYGWILQNRYALPRPVPVVGRQGIWETDPAVTAAVKAQSERWLGWLR